MSTKGKSKALRRVSLILFGILFSLITTSVAFADAIYWTTKPNTMPTARTRAMSAVVGGNIYVLGGATSTSMPPSGITNAVEMYNPVTDTWVTKPALSIGGVPQPRFAAGCVALGNDIYIIGGGSGQGGGAGATNTVLKYDTTNGTTTQIGVLNRSRFRTACAIINNKIYVVGGAGGPGVSTTIEAFNLSTNTSQDVYTSMSFCDNTTVLADGTNLYILGGWNSGGNATKSCWKIDTTVNPLTPEQIADMLYARAGYKGAFSRNGKIIVGGGVGDWPPTGTNSQSQQYDPSTNTWTARGSVPQPAFVSPAMEFVNNCVYLIGGADDAQVYGTVRAGNITSGTTTDVMNPPTNATCNVDGKTVSLVFPGGTTVNPTDNLSVTGLTTGPAALNNALPVSQYYDIATSVDFSGTVTITMPYDNTLVSDPSKLKLYHWNGSSWDALTTTVDEANHTVSAATSSLSPFVVGEASAASSGLRGFGMNTNIIALLAGLLALGGMLLMRTKRVSE